MPTDPTKVEPQHERIVFATELVLEGVLRRGKVLRPRIARDGDDVISLENYSHRRVAGAATEKTAVEKLFLGRTIRGGQQQPSEPP